jgi:multidrug efflux pump subunit AcrA (membrane-fusion protein)
MNATCEFIVDRKENVVSVPTEAVRSDDQGSFVEIASGGKPAPTDDPKNPPDPDALVDVKTRRVAVEVGLEGNDSVEIKSGVKEGDTVVSQTIEPAPAAAGGAIGGGGFGGRPGGGGRR